MKPDWNSPDCPKWARYLAQYASGAWYWFEDEPKLGNAGWWINSGRYCPVCRGDWRCTLEERPVHRTSFDYTAMEQETKE